MKMKALALAAIGLAGLVGLPQAKAETNEVRIASTFGLAQLPGRIAYQEGFIKKRAAALGIKDLKVTYQQVASGVVVSTLLLADRADIGVGGNVPLFHLWEKTKGKIKGVMAFSQGNMVLVSCDPRIKSIKDYTANDRIAMTGIKTTTYAMILQMQAAKAFGWDKRTKLDDITLSMSNPDATAAILTCRTPTKSHMTILPHSTFELKTNKQAHVVFSSKDFMGHPYTFVAAFAKTDFKAKNPTVYKAVVQGLGDAIKFIQKNPEKAVAIYTKAEPTMGKKVDLVSLIKGETADQFSYTEAPNSTKAFIDFMNKAGMMHTPIKSWKDVWFDNVWNLPGS